MNRAPSPRGRVHSRPTLFLDFDGVLHPNLATPTQRFIRMPMLLEAIGDQTVEIVISSSWRFEWSIDELREFFPAALRARIVSNTGSAYIGRHARWNEITAYCEAFGIGNWRALDDARFEFPNPCPELIACDGGRGMEAAQRDLIRTWLERITSS